MSGRKYDVVVLGATGYTGRLVVDYLLTSETGKALKWAIAGRSLDRLRALLVDSDRGKSVDCMVADTQDASSLDNLCSQATVMMALAGPFDLVGMPVVDACLRHSTHYVDITGEFSFVRRVIEKHHEAATRAGISVVPCCGFDSVPGDMGNFFMHSLAPDVAKVEAFYRLRSAGASGGTLASVANVARTITKEDMSPVSLNPPAARKGVLAPVRTLAGYSGALKSFTAPFFMAAINERVARRSNALEERPAASYSEAVAGSLVACVFTTAVFWTLGVVMALPPLRALATKMLPASGTGPSAAAKADKRYSVTFIATTAAARTFKGVWKDNRDAYDATAVTVAEAAKVLVDRTKKGDIKAGVTTPAVGLGADYLARLQECGVSVTGEELK